MARGAVRDHAGVMTSTPPQAPPGAPGPTPGDPAAPQGPRVTRDEVRDLGRLRRTTEDRRIAGVAGGLARHLDIDPVIVRVAFVVLVFFGGAGVVLYGAAWLLVPADDQDRARLALDERTRGIALVLVAGLALLLVLGDSWGDRRWLGWPLVLAGVVALLVLGRRPAAPHSAPPALPAAGQPAGPAGALTATATAPIEPVEPVGPVGPVVPATPVAPVAPRRARRRGPILFWFTLALVALLEGLLGLADVAGVRVTDSAYPALAVGTIAVMLLVGAFYGRAGGLVLLGLLATLGLAASTAAEHWDGGDQVHATPRTAAGVQDTYRISAGELVLDLRSVRDPAALDGRTIHLRGDVGRLEVVLPAGVDVDARAVLDGAGDIALFGADRSGFDVASRASLDGGTGVPALDIDARLGVGQIDVHTR